MYVDCIHDRENDIIKVVERVNGKRSFIDYKANYTFYYKDPKGKYTSLYGDKLSKFTTNNNKKFRAELKMATEKTFESDINPIFRCLEDNYNKCENPNLHVCFLDIEVDFDPINGYSSPDDPQTAITAITVYMAWLDQCITLVLPPPTISFQEAEEICGQFDNTIPFDDEKVMLECFLDLMEDVDLVTGWNSALYDIPYIIRRIELILSKEHTKKLCLWDKAPIRREVDLIYGKSVTYDLVGRVHLDYLDLYKKHTYQEQSSYRLDYIGEVEVGENKVVYEGSLDQLYKEDFPKFIEYNRQDVMLLYKIDKKLKFIELSNLLAHQNCVLLKTTLGSVALIEQAILLEAHERGMILCDRKTKEENDENSLIIHDESDDEEKRSVAGAYVADPIVGINEWIGSIDINSLYPSVIRCLNMSPDTIFAQIRQTDTQNLIIERFKEQQRSHSKDKKGSSHSQNSLFETTSGSYAGNEKLKKASMAECWNGLFSTLEYNEVMNRTDKILTLDIEGVGDQEEMSIELTANELYEFIFEKGNFSVSANGTLFKNDIEGIVPGLLRRWYSERTSMKKTAGNYWKMYDGVDVKNESLLEMLKD